MTTSIRISKTGTPTPLGGFMGAIGATVPSHTVDVEIGTDDLGSISDIVGFLEEAAPLASMAFLSATHEPSLEEEIASAEVTGEDNEVGDEPDNGPRPSMCTCDSCTARKGGVR